MKRSRRKFVWLLAYSTQLGIGMAAAQAHAQSSITLYGLTDMYLDFTTNNAAAVAGQSGAKSVVRLTSGGLAGSRWGLRGVEDLGGGFKAVFVLENGFNVDNGTMFDSSRIFNRQSFVGIQGKFGQLTFGRQYTTMFDTLANLMPQYFAPTYEPLSAVTGPFRFDNGIKYKVGLGGLTLQAHYAFGERAGSLGASAAMGAGAAYTSGPLSLVLTYDQNNGAPTDNGYSKGRRAAVSAMYRTGAVKLTSGYRWEKDVSGPGETARRDDLFWVGVGYQPLQSLQLTAAFYYDDVKVAGPVSHPPNPRQYVLQAIYSVSKRTDLYGAVAFAQQAGLNFAPLSALAAGKTNQTGVALGIRHIF